MAHVLKIFELAQKHGMSKMQIGRGRIKASFDASGSPVAIDLLEFGAKFRLLHDFGGALPHVGKLFVNRGKYGI